MSTAVVGASVGDRIKAARRQRGLSQAELAHPEVSDSYVSLIESGKRIPTPGVLELLADKLGCSVLYLRHGVTPEQTTTFEEGLREARTALETGAHAQARARYAELVHDSGLTGLPELHRKAELGLAAAMQACGELDEAITLLERIRQREEPLSVDAAMTVIGRLSSCYRQRGDLTSAVAIAEPVVLGSPVSRWDAGIIQLGVELLAAYVERGDLLRAQQFCRQLVAAAERLAAPPALAAAWRAAAVVAAESGQTEQALTAIERAIAAQLGSGAAGASEDRVRSRYAAIALSVAPERGGAWRPVLSRALEELRGLSGAGRETVRCAVDLVRAELAAGAVRQAQEHLAVVDDRLEELPHDVRAERHLLAGQIMAELGRPRDALAELSAAGAWLATAPPTRRIARAWLAIARIREDLDDVKGSAEAYQQALAHAGL